MSKKTILVVEDEKVLRESIAEVLNNNNFSSLEAKDGEEAITIALSKHPDLILLDLLMPGMDGMTALKKIREDAWGKKVPVIVLTNLNPTSEKIIEDVVTHKPLQYLIKTDWKLEDVVKEIEKALR